MDMLTNQYKTRPNLLGMILREAVEENTCAAPTGYRIAMTKYSFVHGGRIT
jgi:hypothetical protein